MNQTHAFALADDAQNLVIQSLRLGVIASLPQAIDIFREAIQSYPPDCPPPDHDWPAIWEGQALLVDLIYQGFTSA